MKKVLLIALISSGVSLVNAQTQIGNSDFEQWETANGGEPVNWNSFESADGTWSSFAGDQVDQSSDVRPGSSGTSSAKITARNPIGSTIANGNLTTGKIRMGSTDPSSSDNYNRTVTSDPDFSEAITDMPDSIVFWVKLSIGAGEEGRVKATLHDNYDYRDPEDGTAAAHVVASAVRNFGATTGWVRQSVPFVYSGPASSVEYILVTFTTNKNPGGGAETDVFLLDDVELIYNPASSGISEIDNKDGIVVSMDESKDLINIISNNELKGDYTIFNSIGQEVQLGDISSTVEFNGKPGVYFIHLNTNGKAYSFKFMKN